MKDELFKELLDSVKWADKRTKQKRREAAGKAVFIKSLRARTRLSQAKFAALIDVPVSTLRNWEQGVRIPTGPAKTLLRLIERDPAGTLKTLSE